MEEFLDVKVFLRVCVLSSKFRVPVSASSLFPLFTGFQNKLLFLDLIICKRGPVLGWTVSLYCALFICILKVWREIETRSNCILSSWCTICGFSWFYFILSLLLIQRLFHYIFHVRCIFDFHNCLILIGKIKWPNKSKRFNCWEIYSDNVFSVYGERGLSKWTCWDDWRKCVFVTGASVLEF